MHRLMAEITPPASPPRNAVVITGAIFVLYYLAARFSLLLQVQPEAIAVFWPASGLAAGALLALGPSARGKVATAVILATIVANVEHGASVPLSIVFGFCNALECVALAEILVRTFSAPFQLNSLSRVFGFIGATLAATSIAAFPAAVALVYIAHVPVDVNTLWHVWLESDAVGVVAVAPLLIAIPPVTREPPTPIKAVEGVVLLGLVSGTAHYIFTGLPAEANWTTIIPLVMLYPLLLWLAVRCPPIFAAAASFAVALVIVYCVQNGLGALGQTTRPLADRIVFAQAAIVTLALCTLVFSALIASQRSIEAQLSTKEQRLRIATTAAGLGVFEWHAREDRAYWENERMYEIFGVRKGDPALSFREFATTCLEPEERERLLKERSMWTAPSELYASCRFRRKDGVMRDLEIIGVLETEQGGQPERVVGVMADVTERRRAEERQALLIAELDHRVKNALERVASLIASTRSGARDMEDYIERLGGRIHSMARAHQLLSRERWSGVELTALVAENLEAYDLPGRVVIGGTKIKLTAEATQAFSMVLHELATNAAKYGALSVHGGQVEVTWERHGDALILQWMESGGPPVETPTREGFGSKVIRNPIEYELDGRVELAFGREGVRCRITVPMSKVSAD